MNVYTDPRLLDVAGALTCGLPLGGESSSASAVLKATGTDDSAAKKLRQGLHQLSAIGANWVNP